MKYSVNDFTCKNNLSPVRTLFLVFFLFFVQYGWGESIVNNVNKGWDGKANDGTEMAQQDTYVWKMNARSLYGKQKQLVGHLNLIR